jgi:hypothetical protein
VIGGLLERSCTSALLVSTLASLAGSDHETKLEVSIGYPPFCSENPHQVYQKIIKWEDYLQIPSDVHLSREAEGMIRG